MCKVKNQGEEQAGGGYWMELQTCCSYNTPALLLLLLLLLVAAGCNVQGGKIHNEQNRRAVAGGQNCKPATATIHRHC
jgi:hypothetical protein